MKRKPQTKKAVLGGIACLLSLPCLFGATYSSNVVKVFPHTLGPLFRKGSLDGVKILFERYSEYPYARHYYAKCTVAYSGEQTKKVVEGTIKGNFDSLTNTATFDLEEALPIGRSAICTFWISLNEHYTYSRKKIWSVYIDRTKPSETAKLTSDTYYGRCNYISIYFKDSGATVTTRKGPTYTFGNFTTQTINPAGGRIDLSVFNMTYTSGAGHKGLPTGEYEDAVSIAIKGQKIRHFLFLSDNSMLRPIPIKLQNLNPTGDSEYGLYFPFKMAVNPLSREMEKVIGEPSDGFYLTEHLYLPRVDVGSTDAFDITVTVDGTVFGTGDKFSYSYHIENSLNSFGNCSNSDYCVGVGL